jgi:hypothetical protein
MPGPAQARQERVLSENAIPTGMTATAGASVAGWGAAYDGWEPSMLIEVSGLGGAYRVGSVETPAEPHHLRQPWGGLSLRNGGR